MKEYKIKTKVILHKKPRIAPLDQLVDTEIDFDFYFKPKANSRIKNKNDVNKYLKSKGIKKI